MVRRQLRLRRQYMHDRRDVRHSALPRQVRTVHAVVPKAGIGLPAMPDVTESPSQAAASRKSVGARCSRLRIRATAWCVQRCDLPVLVGALWSVRAPAIRPMYDHLVALQQARVQGDLARAVTL